MSSETRSIPVGAVMVTGAGGFVGRAVVDAVARSGELVTAVVRSARSGATLPSSTSVAVKPIGDLSNEPDLGEALETARIVIHCAARAHVMNDDVAEPLEVFRRVNVAGTLNLARKAAEAGTRRFVFFSSIKVNGERTKPGARFTAEDPPAPEDPYGMSKLEAEQGLQKIAHETGMEVVIIRPPLVYGPGVKGNFVSMVKLVEKGLPLPFGAVHNKRSFLALDNLVDLIITCIEHPAAANEIFLVSDGEDLSTSDLLRRVASTMGKSSRLLSVPVPVLQFGAKLLGKKDMAQRLLGSLQVDISKSRDVLGWEPPISVDEGLRRCFRNNQDV